MWAALGSPHQIVITPGVHQSLAKRVKGGTFQECLLNGWWLEAPRWFVCSIWIGGTSCTMASCLGKGASLNLQPSVNGAIDYVVAGASHLNWAEPSDKPAAVGGDQIRVR